MFLHLFFGGKGVALEVPLGVTRIGRVILQAGDQSLEPKTSELASSSKFKRRSPKGGNQLLELRLWEILSTVLRKAGIRLGIK